MQNLRGFITSLRWPMVFLLPFWITFGRGFLGSGGFQALFDAFTAAPILLVALIVINVIIQFNSTFKLERLVTKPQAIILALLYNCVFSYGIFVVDGDDNVEHLGSVATHILGRGFLDISQVMSEVFYYSSAVLLLTAFVVSLGGLFTRVRS